MEYNAFEEVNIDTFDGRAFACIAMNKPNECRQRILMLSSFQLLEAVKHPNRQGIAVIQECHPLEGLTSIKFSRTKYGILILVFRSELKLEYKVKDAGVCADFIKRNMSILGISGKVSMPKKVTDAISSAEDLLYKTMDLEIKFSIKPSLELVQELVETLRIAVERFDEASDNRYMTAIHQIQKFLARGDVILILDESAQKRMAIQDSVKVSASIQDVIFNEPQPAVNEPKIISSFDTSSHEVNTLSNKTNQEEYTELVPTSISTSNIGELHDMLGNLTQEFDDLLSTFDTKPSESDANELQIDDFNLDDIDTMLNSTSFLDIKI